MNDVKYNKMSFPLTSSYFIHYLSAMRYNVYWENDQRLSLDGYFYSQQLESVFKEEPFCNDLHHCYSTTIASSFESSEPW